MNLNHPILAALIADVAYTRLAAVRTERLLKLKCEHEPAPITIPAIEPRRIGTALGITSKEAGPKLREAVEILSDPVPSKAALADVIGASGYLLDKLAKEAHVVAVAWYAEQSAWNAEVERLTKKELHRQRHELISQLADAGLDAGSLEGNSLAELCQKEQAIRSAYAIVWNDLIGECLALEARLGIENPTLGEFDGLNARLGALLEDVVRLETYKRMLKSELKKQARRGSSMLLGPEGPPLAAQALRSAT